MFVCLRRTKDVNNTRDGLVSTSAIKSRLPFTMYYYSTPHTLLQSTRPTRWPLVIDNLKMPCASNTGTDRAGPTFRYIAPKQAVFSLVPDCWGGQIPDSSRDGVAYPRPLFPVFFSFSLGLTFTACSSYWKAMFQPRLLLTVAYSLWLPLAPGSQPAECGDRRRKNLLFSNSQLVR
jgi:hypothetical protein